MVAAQPLRRGRVENLGGWLTTVVARVSLNMLRSRATRREEALEDVHVPEPLIARADATDPEHQALLADSVGLALLVVLETLHPRSGWRSSCTTCSPCRSTRSPRWSTARPTAARQLASRARRRVRGAAPAPDADLNEQRRVVDAFFAAAHDGDFDGLVALLHPDVVVRSDGGAGRSSVVQGAEAVAGRAMTFPGSRRTCARRS